jgi:hypothetical protein
MANSPVSWESVLPHPARGRSSAEWPVRRQAGWTAGASHHYRVAVP